MFACVNNIYDEYKTSKLWYFIVAIYVLYYLQGILYPSGGIISQLLVIILLLTGLYSFIKTCSLDQKIPTVILLIAAFWIMLTITFIVSPNEVYSEKYFKYMSAYEQYKSSTIFCLSAFIGYVIGKERRLSEFQILVTALLLLGLSIVKFIHNAAIEKTLREVAEVTNNSAYMFLYVLPFLPLLFRKYPKICFAIGSCVFIFVISGMKRGAIICMAAMVVCFVWWYCKNYKVNIRVIIISVIIICLGCWYLSSIYAEDEYMQQRVESTIEGNSSGRDKIYYQIWETWYDGDNGIEKLFGKGSAQSVSIAGNFAHNDFLEVLIDNGLLGIILYLMIFFSLINYINHSKIDKYLYLSLLLWVIYWFSKSLFSMGYTSLTGCMTMLLMGYEIREVQDGNPVE